MRPGDGEESVYSPVNVNVTLHCAVSNTNLERDVDGLSFDSDVQRPQLHLRGIFKIVFGSRELNNNTRICCQSFVDELRETCTTLIIVYGKVNTLISSFYLRNWRFFYNLGRPSPPTQVSIQNARGVNLINISWAATTMTGMNQSYIIVFDEHIIKTTYLHHIFHQEITSADSMAICGLFLAYVKAVNGAGESDPSNNVSIPSLPDIGPVTASLTHQVWKYDGEIRIYVSFQVRHYNHYSPKM